MNYIYQIERLSACEEAIDWLKSHNYPDLKSAWDACGNPTWLVWLLMRTSGHFDSEPRKAVLRLLIELARETYPDYESVTKALRVMERWCEGITDVSAMKREFFNALGPTSGSGRISVYISALQTCTIGEYVVDAANYAHLVCLRHAELTVDERMSTIETVLRHFPNPPALTPPNWSLT